MSRANRKFLPEWKFKYGTYLIIKPVTIFKSIPTIPVPDIVTQEFVGVVKHYQIYNRNNMKYLCKCLKTGEFVELDKKFVEDHAKLVDSKVANVLFSTE